MMFCDFFCCHHQIKNVLPLQPCPVGESVCTDEGSARGHGLEYKYSQRQEKWREKNKDVFVKGSSCREAETDRGWRVHPGWLSVLEQLLLFLSVLRPQRCQAPGSRLWADSHPHWPFPCWRRLKPDTWRWHSLLNLCWPQFESCHNFLSDFLHAPCPLCVPIMSQTECIRGTAEWGWQSAHVPKIGDAFFLSSFPCSSVVA